MDSIQFLLCYLQISLSHAKTVLFLRECDLSSRSVVLALLAQISCCAEDVKTI